MQPLWCKAGTTGLVVDELAADIPSKVAALAMEALLAAKEIAAAPTIARGGPWLCVRLSAKDRIEISASAECKDLGALLSVANMSSVDGHLHQHLNGLRFCGATQNPPVASGPKDKSGKSTTTNLASCKRQFGQVTKTRRSGKTGYEARTNKGLKYGSARFSKAKWGTDGWKAHLAHNKKAKARMRDANKSKYS
jgi:hypothetical protein